MEFTKGLRQKFSHNFKTKGLRQKFSHNFKTTACIYILPFLMPTKYILWGSILPMKVISVDCNKNLHNLFTYKFLHLSSCGKNNFIKMADSQ